MASTTAKSKKGKTAPRKRTVNPKITVTKVKTNVTKPKAKSRSRSVSSARTSNSSNTTVSPVFSPVFHAPKQNTTVNVKVYNVVSSKAKSKTKTSAKSKSTTKKRKSTTRAKSYAQARTDSEPSYAKTRPNDFKRDGMTYDNNALGDDFDFEDMIFDDIPTKKTDDQYIERKSRQLPPPSYKELPAPRTNVPIAMAKTVGTATKRYGSMVGGLGSAIKGELGTTRSKYNDWKNDEGRIARKEQKRADAEEKKQKRIANRQKRKAEKLEADALRKENERLRADHEEKVRISKEWNEKLKRDAENERVANAKSVNNRQQFVQPKLTSGNSTAVVPVSNSVMGKAQDKTTGKWVDAEYKIMDE